MSDFSSPKTIPDFLFMTANRLPRKVGLVFEDQEYTYHDLAIRAEMIGRAVGDIIKRGDVVALLLPNSLEFVVSYFGILRAGGTVLLLPSNISDHNLHFQLTATQPTCIVSSPTYREKVKRVSGSLQTFLDVTLFPQGGMSVFPDIAPSDRSTILFTSGTVGKPKGVVLRHRNVVQATENIMTFLRFNEKDCDVNISPLSHSFGLGHLHCLFRTGGTTILFRDAINLPNILNTIIQRRATTFGVVPTILRLLLEHYRKDLMHCDRILRFIQTNTSSLEPALIQGMMEALPHVDFHYYYGLTEASRSTFITLNRHLEKLRSVGQASPNVTIEIRDADDRCLPPGTVGEICISGRHVIEEYWRDRGASEHIHEGWLHTKDLGYLDRDGYLFIVGRTDDMINVAGEKVSPLEIEAVLLSIPGVIDVAVVSMPDRLLGEAVKAYVVVSDVQLTDDAMRTVCRRQLESFKIPRVFERITKIPRTENGKIQRNELKQRSYV